MTVLMVKGAHGNHFPNPSAFLADLPGVGGVSMFPREDCSCCSRDYTVAKPTSEATHACGSSLCKEEPLPMNVGEDCLLHRLLGDLLGRCSFLISIFDENPTNGAAMRHAHDVVNPPPEAPVRFPVNYGQYLLLPLIILALLCAPEAGVEVIQWSSAHP
jgi:hypothetical protein